MKKIVTLGGGTGNFVVLSGLKHYPVNITAIVSMADDGGSTGILRDELGVLPPGDVRQCLVALSDSSRLMRSLMNYRFENGGLEGHNFGNLFLSALEKVTGSFERAVEEVGQLLSIKGKVVPVTVFPVHLRMWLNNGEVLEGEKEIYLSKNIKDGYKSVCIEPYAQANPKAIDDIMNADLIIFSPGGLYTSLIPNLLVEGIPQALRESKAKKLLIVNMINKKTQTPEFKVSTYVHEFERFLGKDIFDFVLINSKPPSPELVQRYSEEGSLVDDDLNDARAVRADVIEEQATAYDAHDILASHRAFIRHDFQKLATEIMKIVREL